MAKSKCKENLMSTSEKRQRTAWVPPTRCFPEEKNLIAQKAADCSMSVGQYMVAFALGRPNRSKVDSIIINELRRLGGLQKHFFVEGQGGLSREYADILDEIKQAIMRVAAQK
jgi:hypothetical protein